MGLLLIATATMLLLGVGDQVVAAIGADQAFYLLVHKLVDALVKIAEIAAKFSSPRLQFVTGPAVSDCRASASFWASPPCPRSPQATSLPSIALAVICLGVLNRDGLVVLAGVGHRHTGTIDRSGRAVARLVRLAAVGEVVEDLIDTDPGSDGRQQ